MLKYIYKLDHSLVKINNLEKELITIQPLHKQAVDHSKVLKAEIETLRTENLSLSKKTQKDSEDKMCLLDKIDQLEMQLVAITEKHKICQKEV